MGFFFSNQKKEKAVKAQRTARATQKNVETLNRLGCRVCPLNEAKVCTPKMQPTLVKDTLVYFLRSSPDEFEDERGAPCASSLLISTIPKGMKKYCAYDNIVRDRCEKPTWQEIECCRGHVTKSIEEAKPRLIVGFGAQVLSWALGSTDVEGMRGRVFAIKIGNHECWFMPVYDDQFLLDMAFKKDKPLNSKFGHTWRKDIERAFRVAQNSPQAKVLTIDEIKADVQCFDGSEGIAPVLALIKQATNSPVAAIDLETSALRPYVAHAKILTVALSYGDTHFSFALDHPKAKWSTSDRKLLLSALLEFLKSDVVKIAHNAPFEIEWLVWQFNDPSIIKHNKWECTQMQAHFLDERRGKQHGDNDHSRATYQKLDFLIKMYFGIAYKGHFKLPKHDMASADLGETLIYNGADTKLTLKAWLHQTKLLKEQNLYKAYRVALPRQATVGLMQSFGILVDQASIKEIQAKLGKEVTELETEIDGLQVVKDYIKDHGGFNWQSNDDAVAIFRDYLKSEEINITDKSGKKRISTDKNVLDRIDHPLAKSIIKLRNRAKLKSTYADEFELEKGTVIFPDGRLHTSFNTTFTVTGRLSSDEPNLQNFPKRVDSWVRKSIIPDKNHLIVAFDYGQLEACTSAICSGDTVMIQALWEDYDFHMEWTHKLARVYPEFLGTDSLGDSKAAKRYRSIVKNKLVFPAIFGASNKSISGYLKVPEDKIEILMKEFWKTFCGLKNWQDKLMKGYYEDGYVTSPTGRRHYAPLTRNEAINFPIQGFACDIVCDSMNTLSAEALETGEYHLHPILNIHDDLTFVLPDSDALLEDAIRRIYTVMLTPAYDCINVPFSVECSLGKNWWELADIGKFWSHRDLECQST